MSDAASILGRKLRVLVTRASGQASALADELRQLGAEPINIPILEVVPPDSFEELDAALHRLAHFDWLIVTSGNAVEALAKRAKLLNLSLHLDGIKIAAIGPATARALEPLGLKADLIPASAIAESLAEALLPHATQPDGRTTKFLLVRAQEGREVLPEALRAAGAEVTIVAAYKTQMPTSGIDELQCVFGAPEGPPDGVTLTSSSAAANFFSLLSAAGLTLDERTVIASIGPITSNTLRELGRPPDVEAQEATVASLAKAMTDYLNAKS